MANPIKSDDINFQPPVKSYAYSSSNPVPKSQITINPVPENPSAKNNSRNVLNTIVTLIFSVLGFLFLFFIFLVVLNYFNVISLPKLLPQLSKLPRTAIIVNQSPIFSPTLNAWTAKGIFYNYDKDKIFVKINDQILELKLDRFSDFVYSSQQITSANPNFQPISIDDSNFKTYLNKNVSVDYAVNNEQKVLIILRIFK